MSQMDLQTWVAAGKRTLLTIDDDQTTIGSVNALASRHPTLTPAFQSNGKLGLEQALAMAPDLIVIGWKLKSMAGPALFNRLRMHERHAVTPVLVISDAVKKKDFRLLDEFPCTRLEEKPLSEPRLAQALDLLVKEKTWNDSHSADIAAQFKAAKGNPAALMQSLRGMLRSAPNPLPVTLLIGDTLLARGHLAAAETIYKKALELDAKNLMALNGLGRALYKQNKHAEAAAALRVATRESQANIGRLCLLGEMELAQINPDAARKHFDQALAIDADSPRAKAGHELCSTLSDFVRHHAGANLPRNFAAVCNTMAVTLVRAGQMEKGIAQYKAALQLVSDPYAAAQVMFNLGLGFLRWQKPTEARHWFARAEAKSGGKLAKASRFRALVEQATGGGATAHDAFDLSTVDQEMAAQAQATKDEETLDDDIARFEAEMAMDIFEEEKI